MAASPLLCVARVAEARASNPKPCGAYYMFTIFFGPEQERPPLLNPRPASLDLAILSEPISVLLCVRA